MNYTTAEFKCRDPRRHLLASCRYMDELMRLKAAAAEQGCDYLTWNDIQACIDQVNLAVQEEHERKEPFHSSPAKCVSSFMSRGREDGSLIATSSEFSR